MLNALSSHSQGCALLFLTTKGSLDDDDTSHTPSKLEMLAYNQKLGKLAKDLAKGEVSDQEISRILTKLPCKLESVRKGKQCDEKFEEANSLEMQVLPLT